MEILNKLYQEQTATNFILKRVLAKIERMETNLKMKDHVSQDKGELDEQFMVSFPIRNKDEFLSIERRIQDEADFMSKLVYNL